MKEFMSLLKIGGWLSVLGSLLFLTAALILYRHTESFVHSASRAQGTVTKLVLSDKFYFPVYTFKDARGVKHSVQSLSGSNPAAYKIGDVVGVLYQPDAPDNAEIDTFLDVWIWPLGLAGFGALVLLFGFAGFVVSFFLRKLHGDSSTVQGN